MTEGVCSLFSLRNKPIASCPEDPEGQGQGAEEGGGDADTAGEGALVAHLLGHNVARRGGHAAQHDQQGDELLVGEAEVHRHGQEDGGQEDESLVTVATAVGFR